MFTPRLLALPLLISVAVAVQTHRVSGSVCFAPPSARVFDEQGSSCSEQT
jgi:hypothetical protein